MSRLTEPLGPHDHVLGRPAAPAQIVEYGDYECPFCARAHHEMATVLRSAGNVVRYAFRHFPLAQIHPHALLAAQAAEAAGAQGRFWMMHSMLFENPDSLAPSDLMVYAETLGLDVRRFARELRNGAHLPKVESDFRTGVRSGVNGTPTFFIDGVRHDRGWHADSITAAVREATERAAAVLSPPYPSPLHR
jgi:protein-disulfide isomerase